MSKIIVIEQEEFDQRILHGIETAMMKFTPEFFVAEEVLTLEEASRFLKCSVSTLQKMIRDGLVVPHRPSKDPRFLTSELIQFVKNS